MRGAISGKAGSREPLLRVCPLRSTSDVSDHLRGQEGPFLVGGWDTYSGSALLMPGKWVMALRNVGPYETEEQSLGQRGKEERRV